MQTNNRHTYLTIKIFVMLCFKKWSIHYALPMAPTINSCTCLPDVCLCITLYCSGLFYFWQKVVLPPKSIHDHGRTAALAFPNSSSLSLSSFSLKRRRPPKSLSSIEKRSNVEKSQSPPKIGRNYWWKPIDSTRWLLFKFQFLSHQFLAMHRPAGTQSLLWAVAVAGTGSWWCW